MSHKFHSHSHKLKRLNHKYQYNGQMMIKNLPSNIIHEDILNKSSKYIKFFDYPLSELLVDHSTNPLQNTTRQYNDISLNIPNEGRFTNHEMIIRRNGETTILRPKQDLVLANGFTPVIRPSSILPSYKSIMSQSEIASSLSIMNKMSIKKSEQTSIIKTKRKNRYQRKRCNEKLIRQNNLQNYNVNFSNDFNHNNSQETTFFNIIQQALFNIMEERNSQPLPSIPPLMSILPQFHNHNQSFTSPFDEPCFNQQQLIPSNNQYNKSFYNFPQEQNHQFNCNFPQHEHMHLHPLMSDQRNYSHIPGYFF